MQKASGITFGQDGTGLVVTLVGRDVARIISGERCLDVIVGEEIVDVLGLILDESAETLALIH
jgi:hypothetical protein